MKNTNPHPNTRKIIAASVAYQKALDVFSKAVTQSNKAILELSLAFRRVRYREKEDLKWKKDF